VVAVIEGLSWVLASPRWCGCNGLYEVVCGVGEVVDLDGVDDWGSGSWFGGFRVMYVARRSKSGMCILGVAYGCGGSVWRVV